MAQPPGARVIPLTNVSAPERAWPTADADVSGPRPSVLDPIRITERNVAPRDGRQRARRRGRSSAGACSSARRVLRFVGRAQRRLLAAGAVLGGGPHRSVRGAGGGSAARRSRWRARRPGRARRRRTTVPSTPPRATSSDDHIVRPAPAVCPDPSRRSSSGAAAVVGDARAGHPGQPARRPGEPRPRVRPADTHRRGR